MEKHDLVESPRKRQKTSDASPEKMVVAGDGAADVPTTTAVVSDAQGVKEVEVGITEFVSSDNEGFSGILKKRYTDFMVNEITTAGEVVHLRNTNAPDAGPKLKPVQKAPETGVKATDPTEETQPTAEPTAEPTPVEFQVSDEDRALLSEFFGAENATTIITMHKEAMAKPKARPSEFGKVTVAISDRDLRTKIHQNIRRIFNSEIDSTTDQDGNMAITAANNRFKRAPNKGGRGGDSGARGQGPRINWEELGGPYLHFTIYKENKDTMEIISFIARSLKMNPKSFQFAGTKDRRGVTAQRACATRVLAERLAKLNPTLRNATLGDFKYSKQGLDLGDLLGNEFHITLRESDIPGVNLSDPESAVAKATEVVGTSLKNLRERGYFNYYGLQRFGTFTTRTDTIGLKILQSDFKGACDDILSYSPHVLEAANQGDASTMNISNDDKARAMAIHMFETKIATGAKTLTNDILSRLPRKFSAESNIIRHLLNSRNDYLGALQSIPRNLRLMYVHAYQSLVWNFAVGERWRLYSDKVVEGDLVIVQEHRDKETEAPETKEETVDADGEIIIVPQGEDSATAAEDMFTRARALTAEEAASGKYTLFDLVLPQPGYDIIYPANQVKDFYKSFMGSEQGGKLDPFDMRRKWRDASLSGSYRKIFSRMGDDYSFDVKMYSKDDQQFVPTDMDKLKQREAEINIATDEQPDKLAVILKFQLGSSQYATMALRELTKGKMTAYKADFGGGR
ncbi:hypothetical protein PENANT_c022G09306 [Penicillium antarcticum]|uniref:TRUD domain-containing protein n=1 Tax=Penicillium antarcticum TaxID=416450 RepID=A0A1V6PZE7_9EURO|nr:hypothetical protein PENANT_c022G09306 [Penicillium antarcticum]